MNITGISVIKAESTASSSGLTRQITIDPAEYPVLSWNWKVANTYQGGDVKVKSGDDYPARIYITFAYDAEKVGIPFFINPYYLSLLHVAPPSYAVGMDLAIRNYIIYTLYLYWAESIYCCSIT